MDFFKTTSVVICVFTLGCGANNYSPPSNPNFVVWDATLYQGKPDLQPFGIQPLTALYSGSLWAGADTTNPPNPDGVASILEQASSSTGNVFLDIENWPLDGDPDVVADSIRKFMVTIQTFEQFAPAIKFGYYGVAPIRDYWDVMSGPGSSEYLAWQGRNNAVAPIAQQASVLFPSLYTFYSDRTGWQKYAIAQISEARRIGPGKPVYVFLWPQFENSSEEYLPPDFWRMELETTRQYADGVVIWGGYQQLWDDNAPWWQQTQSFLQENGSNR
jgi:hypothetical protein